MEYIFQVLGPRNTFKGLTFSEDLPIKDLQKQILSMKFIFQVLGPSNAFEGLKFSEDL